MINKNSNLKLLRLLCVLTFIGSGFGFTVSIISLVNIELISFTKEIPGYSSVSTNSFDAGIIYIYLKSILYAVSIISAILIWKLKLIGFIIYTVIQLLLPTISFVFFPYPFFHTFTLVVPELIFSFAFILLYSLHLDSFRTKSKLKE